LGALNKILMRGLSFTEHSLSIAIYPNIVMVLMTFPFIFSTWVSISWQDCGLFLIVGILAAGGQYAIAQALQLAQTSVLASMDYSTFFWVVALDFVWWNKIPEKHTLIGSIIIIGSNLYILYRAKKIIPDPILDQEN
jgi:drug/metabolite transporter (DMT)-like permease